MILKYDQEWFDTSRVVESRHARAPRGRRGYLLEGQGGRGSGGVEDMVLALQPAPRPSRRGRFVDRDQSNWRVPCEASAHATRAARPLKLS